MLEVFNKRYRACSNIFVQTLEGDKYTFPAPLSLYGTIEDVQKDLKNEIKFTFSSYYNSLLILDFQFSIFMYLLSFDYHIDTIYIEGLEKEDIISEVQGYSGVYNFMNTNILVNMGADEIYDQYKKTSIYNRESD